MEIRKTTVEDLPVIDKIYDYARAYMRKTGNLFQWQGGYPPISLIEKDIEKGNSYVVTEEGKVCATFYFDTTPDPTYARIDGGNWLNEKPYGVIHRIAGDGSARGVLSFVTDWCLTKTDNVRIDTHRDNKVMQHLLDKKGYTYCGVIYLENGDERVAYQITR